MSAIQNWAIHSFSENALFNIMLHCAVIVNSGRVISVDLINPGSGYTSAPEVTISGGGGAGATAVASIENLDNQDSFGDNNKFKEEANDILFSEDNPFGEVN